MVGFSLFIVVVVGFDFVDKTWVVEIVSETVPVLVELPELVFVRCEVVDEFKVVD
jgi:hypothetical protein